MTDHQVAIAMCQLEREASGRWGIARDMNCDGQFTISDLWQWLEWVFFLPGDGLLWALMQWRKAAIFLELTPESYGGWISAAVSAVGWPVAGWLASAFAVALSISGGIIADEIDWFFEGFFRPFKYAFRRWQGEMYWAFVLSLTAGSIYFAATNQGEGTLVLLVLAALFGLFGLISHLDEVKARKKWDRPPDADADPK